MDEITIYGISLVPVVLAMVELLKRVGIPKKLSPIVSLILGILCGFYYLAPGDPKKAIFLGLITGLSAIGLFSGAKNTLEEFSNHNNKSKSITTSNFTRSSRKKIKSITGTKGNKRSLK